MARLRLRDLVVAARAPTAVPITYEIGADMSTSDQKVLQHLKRAPTDGDGDGPARPDPSRGC